MINPCKILDCITNTSKYIPIYITQLYFRILQGHARKKQNHNSRKRSSNQPCQSRTFGLGLSTVALHSLIYVGGCIDQWIGLPKEM